MSALTRTRPATTLPLLLAGALVVAQISYPHVTGGARHGLVQLTVVLFFGASVGHAWAQRGIGFALRLVAVGVGAGLLVEAVGHTTGVPFGDYAYTDALQPQVLGVPWIIPLAWTMMLYPALTVALRLIGAGRPLLGPLVAGAALTAWDLFLDPQMVAAGYWTWAPSGAALHGIPWSNYAGWLLVASAMAALLWPELRRLDDADDRLPLALYVWTWVGSVVAHAVYLDLRPSALSGGIGMGAVVLALARGGRFARRS